MKPHSLVEGGEFTAEYVDDPSALWIVTASMALYAALIGLLVYAFIGGAS